MMEKARKGVRDAGARASCKRNDMKKLERRLHQAPRRKDGSPGMYYVRVRVPPREAWAKNVRLDIPLETNSRCEALGRAAFILRTLQRLGRRVLRDCEVPDWAPRFARYRAGAHNAETKTNDGQMRLGL